MTYGQIAALCGSPRAARIVGGIAHFGPDDLPWQRVVMKDGGLARGFPGGLNGHKQALEADGVGVSADYKVNLQEILWWPPHPSSRAKRGDLSNERLLRRFAPRNDEGRLLVIVGPTASGKSDLAMELAEGFNGEIICSDSRTVYKGMDIGTAKPSKEDQAKIRHHLLDVVEPGESFNVADFKRLAEAVIEGISRRGKLPIMVGGTGLYIDSILFDYDFKTVRSHAEVNAGPLRDNTLVLGLGLNKELIQKRIEQRVKKMLKQGLIGEVEQIIKIYGSGSKALTGIGYRAFADFVQGHKSLDAAKADFVRGDKDLAKRQLTWFKANPHIRWLDEPSQASRLVTSFLSP
jgi:tRNA dimethylallyltransferase